MLEKYFSANATDTRLPAPFDTFEPPLISAASSSVKAVSWRTSIATPLIPLVAIFVGADAHISSEARSAITHLLE